jgi:hypothetical protein
VGQFLPTEGRERSDRRLDRELDDDVGWKAMPQWIVKLAITALVVWLLVGVFAFILF